MMLRLIRLLSLHVPLLVACGSNPSDAEPALLAVAGTYTTAVTLQSSTCTGITVQNMPTTVTHVAGATALSISHASLTWTGQVQTNGAFTTSSRSVTVGTDAVHTLTIAGTFSTTGFDATVTVTVTQTAAPQTCGYVVKWIGTKQGGPNTIPG
jgi:hypothetical protein